MSPEAAFLGNAFFFLLIASLQFGLFDEYFGWDEDDDNRTASEDGDEVDGPFYDEALYTDILPGTAGSDSFSADGTTTRSAFFMRAGDDTVTGSQANDYARGGSGNDTLIMREGDDIALGDSGDDALFGGIGNDRLQGGLGNDALDGSLDDDHLEGGDGNDALRGGQGDDMLFGGEGDDLLVGDSLDGTGGVARGVDVLSGGAGNDTLWLFGNDTGTGDTGEDLFRVINADTPDTHVTITDYDAADDQIEIVYTDTASPPPSVTVADVPGTTDVQISIDTVVVATVTGGSGLLADDIRLTADL